MQRYFLNLKQKKRQKNPKSIGILSGFDYLGDLLLCCFVGEQCQLVSERCRKRRVRRSALSDGPPPAPSGRSDLARQCRQESAALAGIDSFGARAVSRVT